jgi:hypothetical protein
MQHNLGVSVEWTVKERIGGLWVPVQVFHNLLTVFGLDAYATAAGGTWVPPIYLVIDTSTAHLQGAYLPTATVIVTDVDPTVSGDTQLVLSVGQAQQETVTFSNKAGAGPYTWTLSTPLINSHNNLDNVVRAPNVNDTVASVLSEAQYDPVFAANSRAPVAASYSPTTGNGAMQFFMGSTQATGLYVAHVGMADNVTIGKGNLHNYAALGYLRNTAVDLELDVVYQLTNI